MLTQLIRPTIGKKLAALFLALTLISVSAILVADNAFNRHADLAQFVNQTGRLRMLSQSIAYDAHRLVHGQPDDQRHLNATLAEFETALTFLEGEGPRYAGIDAALLTKVQERAQKYLFAVRRLQAVGKGAEQKALRAIENEADAILAAEEEAVQAILLRNDEERRALRFQLFGMLLLGLAVTGGAYLRIRHDIVEPVARLANMARRISAGHLGARIRHDSTDEFGELVTAFNNSADTTQRLIARYREAERAMESTSEGIMISDALAPGHPATYVNPALSRITGYRPEEVVGKNGRMFLGDDLDQPGVEALRQLLQEQRDGMVVLRCYRKDGTPFWNELSVSPVRDGKRVTHTISVFNDISDRIQQDEQLLQSVHHDLLTGLANRALLQDRLAQAVAVAQRHERRIGILFIDIDNFKLINDSLGHEIGDLLLKETANRLTGCLREGDTVARIGGDEFVLLLADMEHEDNVAYIADRVLSAMVMPFQHSGGELYVSASVGASFYPRDGTDGATLLKHADIAMYRAKERGRNNFQVFTEEMQSRIDQRLSLEMHLRKALEREEFVLYYQPQVSMKTGRIVGAEALIRWRHSKMGMVSPVEFIPLAEETGLIVPIGEWVLDTACAQIKAWQDAGLPPLSIAVNLSARQFRQKNLIELVEQSLQRHQINSMYLELELTESMVMHDPEQTVRILRQLKERGVSISLDDFGTGYSSLSHLRRFPIDVLKVDQSFVRDVTTNKDDAAIAASIIALAHSLQLSVIAEGVETQPQLHYLGQQQCDVVQGFYFSRPVPAEEFAAMLAADKGLSGEDLRFG